MRTAGLREAGIPNEKGPCGPFSSYLSVSPYDILIRGQLFQPHGAAGVEFLGGDAHFAAEAELAAVGEAGGAVQVDGGAVHAPGKGVQHGGVAGDHGIAVAGGMLLDVGDGLGGAVHDAHGQEVSGDGLCKKPPQE